MEWWTGIESVPACCGVAPTLAFGIDTPTRLTLSYFKEEENNLPDYGIPFIDGAPAQVNRSTIMVW